MNNDQIIYCSRCGAEMKMSSRYCMKCGNLNENHPDNFKYKKYFNDMKKDNLYTIGSGNNLGINKNGELYANNNGNRGAFLIFNILLLIIGCLVFVILPIFSLDEINFMNIITSNNLFFCFIIGFFGIYFLSFQIMFMKANEPWWCALIPFYSSYVLNNIAFGEGYGWLFIFSFIPGINSIYYLILCYKLGRAFDKSGILTVLFGFIMLPLIAFGSSSYNGNYFVSAGEMESGDTDYSSNKKLFYFCLFLIVLGLGVTVYNSNFVNTVSDESTSTYNYLNVKNAYKNVKDAVEGNNIDCDGEMVEGKTYYFYSDDFIYDYSLSSNLTDQAIGYIKVEYSKFDSNYFVSYYYNGYYLPEVSINDFNKNSFTMVDNDSFNFYVPTGNFCTLD